MSIDAIVLLSFKFVGPEMTHWFPDLDNDAQHALATLPNLYTAVTTRKCNDATEVLGGIVIASVLGKADPALASQVKSAIESSKYSQDTKHEAKGLVVTPAHTDSPYTDLTEQDLVRMALHSLTESGVGGRA